MLPIVDQLKHLREGAGLIRRSELRTLKLSGPDRIRFLNGMVTNDVTKLTPTKSLWAIKTNNRGRVEGLLRMRAQEDALLLDLEASVADRVLGILDQYIIMDDCKIEDVSDQRSVLSVIGPKSDEVLMAVGISSLPAIAADGVLVQTANHTLIRDKSFGPWGVEFHLPCDEVDAMEQGLIDSSIVSVTPEALEVLRVESGVVRNAIDLDEDTIPMEARLEYAIDFEKGCYVGQEVIARATNLGQVNYLLVGLRLDGDGSRLEGAELLTTEGGKIVGEINSVVHSPSLGAWIGLAYVHRKYESVGTALTLSKSEDRSINGAGTVVSLPFVAPLAD